MMNLRSPQIRGRAFALMLLLGLMLASGSCSGAGAPKDGAYSGGSDSPKGKVVWELSLGEIIPTTKGCAGNLKCMAIVKRTSDPGTVLVATWDYDHYAVAAIEVAGGTKSWSQERSPGMCLHPTHGDSLFCSETSTSDIQKVLSQERFVRDMTYFTNQENEFTTLTDFDNEIVDKYVSGDHVYLASKSSGISKYNKTGQRVWTTEPVKYNGESLYLEDGLVHWGTSVYKDSTGEPAGESAKGEFRGMYEGRPLWKSGSTFTWGEWTAPAADELMNLQPTLSWREPKTGLFFVFKGAESVAVKKDGTVAWSANGGMVAECGEHAVFVEIAGGKGVMVGRDISGAETWRLPLTKLPEVVQCRPKHVLVGTFDGGLKALDLKTGNVDWTDNEGLYLSAVAINRDEYIMVLEKDGQTLLRRMTWS